MKYLFLIACSFLLPFTMLAQSTGKTISGMVKDIQNEPIAGASISLLKASDSAMLQIKTARNNGRFEFTNLPAGTFILTITAVGNKKYFSAPLTIDDKRAIITLPVIILTPAKSTNLKEVTVTAKKPLIEQDIDKTIVNVESMISSATSNTLEVLEKTPGVMVDVNGEISLNGRTGILVLIEGRPTYMSGQDLAAYLKSLPGSMLDKIELMSNPPAKYDAAGNAVINIRLKRSKAQGYTGNLTVSYNQGRIGRSYNSLNLNYLKRKITLFGNISYSKDGDYGTDVYNRAYYTVNDEKASSIDLSNYSKYRSNSIMGRVGLDYIASPKTTIGFIASINNRTRKEWMDYLSNSYNGSDDLDSVGTGNTDGSSSWRQVTANANLTHKLNNAGRELSADLNYINYNSDGDQVLQNFVHSPSGSPLTDYAFLYQLPNNVNIYTARADYSHPLKNKTSLSAGIKSTLVNNDNKTDYFSITNNTNDPDYGKSNHFKYRENINAAYINIRKDWKRVGLQLGLRAENTQIKGHQLGNAMVTEVKFSRGYTDVFPTAFISYKLDSLGSHTLSLNYSRRLNRPYYQQLNPFLFFRDQYSYTSGNPYLNPDYSNNVEIGYRFKQFFGISFQYDRKSNVFFNATQVVENIFVSRPENSIDGYMRAIMINTNLSPTKWWNFNLNFGAARFVMRGKIYTEVFDQRMNACRGNLVNQFKFKHDWSGELSGNFVSRILTWQRIIEPRYRLNAAVQKKILKGKGSIKVSIDDMLRSFKQREETVSIKQATSFRTNLQDTRRVGIAFNFSFGKDTFARKRRYTDNTADDVKGRVE